MSSSERTNEAAGILTREELLNALDWEISQHRARASSTGQSRWALILGLSALFWLSIQIWEKGDFSPRSVVTVAACVTVLLNFCVKVANGIDAPLPQSTLPGDRFYAISPVFEALRSSILFAAVQALFVTVAMFWASSPSFALAKWIAAAHFVFVVFGLAFSYVELPPIRLSRPPGVIGASISIFQWSEWLFVTILASSAVFYLWNSTREMTGADIRFGVVVFAGMYLLALVIGERFQSYLLSALEGLRQNVAFMRVPLETAQADATLLLMAGQTASEVVRKTTERLLARISKTQSLYDAIQPSLARYIALQHQIHNESTGRAQPLEAEFDELRRILNIQLKRASRQHHQLLKQKRRIEEHLAFVGLSPTTLRKDWLALSEKVNRSIEMLNKARNEILQALK